VSSAAPRHDIAKQVALSNAAGWLWSKQAADGGWHSTTHRLLEPGQALTPLVLHALVSIEETRGERPGGGEVALEFIRNCAGSGAVVGLADPEVPEYPNYATAYALTCLVAAANEKDRPLIERMREYLIDRQFREENGFGRGTVVYGGWGFGGPLPEGGSPGHMDIHHTRCVLQALRRAGVEDAEMFARAEEFLRLMQRHPALVHSRPPQRESTSFAAWNGPFDGGFYFSPIVLAANKAGFTEKGGLKFYRSYASATCDGVLALLACDVTATDERIGEAAKWLARHPQLDWPGGVPQDAHENWGESIRFTHFAVRAQTMQALGSALEDRIELRQKLTSHQQANGSFQNNDGFLMKEDDPLLCTALAVLALAASP
jgi:hypothetical protein